MIKINVSVEDSASQALRNLINSLTGEQAAEINEVAGRAAVNAATKYHREYDKAGSWRGTRYLGSGRSSGSDFGSKVAAGWNLQSHDKTGAVIANNAEHYAFKVRGGTITPKRGKFLTIPLIRDAKGKTVAEYASVYQQNTGRRLFRPKGKDVLMESTGDGTGDSRVRSVYALVKSVTQRPWPRAVPDDDLIAEAFVKRWKQSLLEMIADQ
jgi:hypothetical protein